MKSPALRGWASILGSPLQPPVELNSRTDNSPRIVATRKSHRDRQFIFYRPMGWPLGSSGTSQHKGDKALYNIINHPNQPAENPHADQVSLYGLFFFSCANSVLSPITSQGPSGDIMRGILTSCSLKKPVLLTEHSPTSHQAMTQAMTLVQVVGCDLFLGYRGLVWEECAMSSDGGGKRSKLL